MAGDKVERVRQARKEGARREGGRGQGGGEAYLKGHIGHGLGQVVSFEAVPVVEMLPHEDCHL